MVSTLASYWRASNWEPSGAEPAITIKSIQLQNHNKTFFHEVHSKKRKEVCVYTSRDLGMPPEEITAGKYTDIGHQ